MRPHLLKPLSLRSVVWRAAAWLATAVCVGSLHAGEVRLKSGFVIEGTPVAIQTVSPKVRIDTGGNNEVYPVVMVDTGMVRYYIGERNVEDVNRNIDLGALDVFKLKQSLGSRGRVVDAVGPMLNVTDFNAQGRRTVTLNSERGPIQLQQGITQIGPKVMHVSTVGLGWDFALATTSVTSQTLDQMIRQATDQQKPEDRFKIARFYLQAGLYLQALAELDAMARDFPELQARVEQFALETRQSLATQLLDELDQRRERGQHMLAYAQAQKFPTEKMSAAILRRVREFLTQYEQARDEGEKALALLGELQGQIQNDSHRETLEAMRSEVRDQLNYESLPRLKAFLVLSEDTTRPADEKLALAYSGWLLGETAAIDSLDKTLNLWKARFEILSYLRDTDAARRQQFLADLLKLEGIGPESVMGLIPHLPPLLENAGAAPGQPTIVDVSLPHSDVSPDSPPVRYHVLLPPEYTPQRRYPVIVELRPVERTPEWGLRWWGGNSEEPLQAQRHGYIVIAPDYLPPEAKGYTYSALAHYAVLQAIRDARKRYSIDSDRIFLAGHGSGGDAAFDIGLSHPDEFAGVIPIAGVLDPLRRSIWENAKWTSWYVVTGQLDRTTFDDNAGTINNMLLGGMDVMLAEYVGRGYESYYSEIHKLFAWMIKQSRLPPPAQFKMESVRANDNRFFWMKGHTLAAEENARPAVPRAANRKPVKPVPRVAAVQDRAKVYSASILTGNAQKNVVNLGSPARAHTIWLCPELVSFDKRLRVVVNAQSKFDDFIEADIATILEDLRIRGDRQRLYQAKLELN